MDLQKRKSRIKFSYFKYIKDKFTYDGLYYQLLYDFADGNLPLRDQCLFKVREEKCMNFQTHKGVWFQLLEELLKTVNRGNQVISKLGYHYVLRRAKEKYIEIIKEANKANKIPKDLLRLYIHKCKERKIYYSLQKVMKIGRLIDPKNSNFLKHGLIQRVSNVNLCILKKMLGNNEMPSIELNTFDNDKESKIK
jgi:hypothetical protein